MLAEAESVLVGLSLIPLSGVSLALAPAELADLGLVRFRTRLQVLLAHHQLSPGPRWEQNSQTSRLSQQEVLLPLARLTLMTTTPVSLVSEIQPSNIDRPLGLSARLGLIKLTGSSVHYWICSARSQL